MLIRCSEKHREECLRYLKQEPALNLFFIGDIENYGFNQGFQTVFVDKDETVHTIYLVFHDSLLITSQENKVDKEFVEKLLNEYTIRLIQGRQSLLDQLSEVGFEKESCEFCITDEIHQEYSTTQSIQKATLEDIESICNLVGQVFNYNPNQDMISKRISSKEGRHVFIKQAGKMIAQANSTAETNDAAMIGGVATDPQYRRLGLATALVSSLCNELLTEGKQPCLFFSNDEAGRIYMKLGFKKIADWTMLTRK